MDKSSFIKLLKKEGFYVDDSKALPTVLCPPGDYNATIKAVKKIKTQVEYNESFSVKISTISAIYAPNTNDGKDMPDKDIGARSEPSDDILEDTPDAEEKVDGFPKSEPVVSESAAQEEESADTISQSDFFSVFDAFD